MHSKVLISMRNFLHPILSLLGMATTPPGTDEFPPSTSVIAWLLFLLGHYLSRDPESIAAEHSRMRSLKVITIRRYKEKKDAEHEYVVAKIDDPDLGRNRYVKIKRYTGDPRQSDSNPHNIPTTSSQSSVVLKKFTADDRVDQIAAWPTSDTCIEIVSCRDSGMIALDLALAAKVIHDQSAEYQALNHQCFWYSAVMVSVLRRSFPKTMVVKKALDNGEESSGKKGGTYRSIQIYSERSEVITEFYNLFEKHKAEVYSSVNLLNTSYNVFLLTIHCLRLRKLRSMLNRKRMRTEKDRKGRRRRREG